MKIINTTLFVFDVYDLNIDKEVRVFIGADSLDAAFLLMEDGFNNYDFIRVAKAGLLKVSVEETAVQP